ncbi:preprotein translocase subunit YajC [Aeromicrobium ginsengisoli]|uniref:preprotein translocase subunit YajC n=1 Tax=Aeromicrobium ginsengisoli TaxID=363867 RepID=UPI00165F231F|nr:preprotein translocase subunit YajC [Aeromicrobium ginsengisoli]
MKDLGVLLPLILLIAGFYFLVLRPARARQQSFVKVQSELAPGARVMIASGIFGDIVSVGDDTIELRVAANTVITVKRQAVAQVIPAEGPETETSTDD